MASPDFICYLLEMSMYPQQYLCFRIVLAFSCGSAKTIWKRYVYEDANVFVSNVFKWKWIRVDGTSQTNCYQLFAVEYTLKFCICLVLNVAGWTRERNIHQKLLLRWVPYHSYFTSWSELEVYGCVPFPFIKFRNRRQEHTNLPKEILLKEGDP